MKRWIGLVLALLLGLSLCACGNEKNTDSPAIPDKAYPQLEGKQIIHAAEYHYTLEEGCCETLNLIFFTTGHSDPNEEACEIYMLDMDSGILYDYSFLDPDLMTRGNSWNLDTREVALMVFFITYECNKDASHLWSDIDTYIHYSDSQIAELSTRLSSGKYISAAVEDLTVAPTESVPESPAALTIDPEFVLEQAKLLCIQLNGACLYQGQTTGSKPEPLNLLLLQSTEFTHLKPESFPHSAAGIYMLDLDTGIWYDGSFLNWDIMVTDNGWNYETKETALMCCLTSYEQSQTRNAELSFSGSGQFAKLDAEALETINQKLLLAELTRTLAPYPYASTDEEPRQLSDAEIAALVHRPAGYIKSVISTVPDAIAYLDLRFPELWMGLPFHNGIDVDRRWLRSAVEIISGDPALASRSCIVNCVTYLLSDNYQIESLIAFWPDPDTVKEDMPEKAINCIRTNNGYLFFDPVLRMQGDAMSRQSDLLPEMTCSSVAEYVENIRQNPILSSAIKFIFKNTGGVHMDFVRSFADGYTITTDSPGIEQVYYSVAPQEPGQHIRPENIGKYKLSTMLGGVTLGVEEVKALVGQEPAIIREEIKTAGDLLMFMLSARLTEGDGCYCTEVDGHTWHWNMDVKTFLRKGRGGCGDCANLANYMLDGDYEEVGFIDHAYYPGGGGSHVYTYILHEGKYYIVDFSWFIFENYETTRDFPVPVLDSLDQWGQKSRQTYWNVCLVMAYDTPGMQYPVIFGEAYEQELGGVYYVLPEGIEYTVLYEAPDGYQYHQIPFDTSAYNWNTFGIE